MNMHPTILIADDDRQLVGILSIRCRRLGIEVEQAYDALAALKSMWRRTPDLVILDVNMPTGSGLNACEIFSSDPAWATIPVIVLTGRTDPETIIRCHQLCAYYVPKDGDVWSHIEPLLLELLGSASTLGPVIEGKPC